MKMLHFVDMLANLTPQDSVNQAVYFAPSVVRHYREEDLTAQETACLASFHSRLAGRTVLDIGVGTGRTVSHLRALAGSYEAVDYSPVMVAHMRRVMPDVAVRLADWRDLSAFADGSFDVIFATNNVIDALGHEDRLKALAESRRLLRDQGLLIFSSHNRGYHGAGNFPRLSLRSLLSMYRAPWRLSAEALRYLRCRANHARLRALHAETPDYALWTDEGHDYACLHYYTTRQIVARQVHAAGMRMLTAFDTEGRVVQDGLDERATPFFLYVAEREPTAIC
jgi:SAM-dependent methyltransferase